MKYDIIIIGGGMVGATLAIALQKSGKSIALVEAKPLSKEDHRLIALSDTSVSLFKNLNMWSSLLPAASIIQEVHVSHRGRFGVTRISANILKLPALGYVVPANDINQVLYATLKDVDIILPATLKNLHQSSDTVTLHLDISGEIKEYQAEHVIGADGTHSTVRQLSNIPMKEIDYGQSAIVTKTVLKRDHQNIAYERFLKEGAIAMLPLKGKEVATIWTDKNARISELMQCHDEVFLENLQKEFGYRLGRLEQIKKRSVYPLLRLEAECHQKNRVFLIGNAVHTIHPIAAQGLNLALYEAAVLVDFLLETHASKDVFTPKQNFSKNLSHHLSWIFSSDFFLLNRMRGMAMIALDLSVTCKEYFVNRALYRHDLMPNLLRNHS